MELERVRLRGSDSTKRVSGGTRGDSVPWDFPQYQPDCAGCHTNDYESGPHKKVDSPRILYTAGELRDCAGSCHVYTDAILSTIDKARSGEHRVTSGGW